MLAILRLYMGVGMKRRRKDLVFAKQIFEMISYFFDTDSNSECDDFKQNKNIVNEVLKAYLESYNHDDDNSVWFDKLKAVADKFGFASDMKAYKADPSQYNGSVSDIAEIVRIAVTGRANTPDLWSIIHIMGQDQMRDKILSKIA